MEISKIIATDAPDGFSDDVREAVQMLCGAGL